MGNFQSTRDNLISTLISNRVKADLDIECKSINVSHYYTDKWFIEDNGFVECFVGHKDLIRLNKKLKLQGGHQWPPRYGEIDHVDKELKSFTDVSPMYSVNLGKMKEENDVKYHVLFRKEKT